MKESFSSVSDRHWINQSHWGIAKQHLKELSTNKSIKKVNNQATAVWRKLPKNVSYKRTFCAPDQAQMLDVWGSQTAESALTWQTR